MAAINLSTKGDPRPPSKKYQCRFNSDWQQTFPGLQNVKNDDRSAYCSVCNLTFSVAHGGKNDVTKHFATPTHKRFEDDAKRTGRQLRLADLRGVKEESMDNKVAKAEALWSEFVAEHNLPFTVADCFTDIAKQMFPDSQIAKKFSCRRTKTAAIVTEALAPLEAAKTTKFAQDGPCSLMVDESNKIDNDKTCAILLRTINTDLGRVQNRFLDIPVVNRANAENLFDAINDSLT